MPSSSRTRSSSTPLLQQAVVEQLLPVQPAELRPQDQVGYIYEPDPMQVLTDLLPRYVEMEIFHALLEGIASEQSARMVAMRSATDNANAMVEDLTLVMNKAQAGVYYDRTPRHHRRSRCGRGVETAWLPTY